jgi:hypothetical protein
MNPRRLSTVPAPLLRSVILATGVVDLLAALGPTGIQNTGAASRNDVSALSLYRTRARRGTAAKLDAQR